MRHCNRRMLLTTLLLGGSAYSQGPLPAFPGAETIGGRGGRVIEVTNLDDSGEGSRPAGVHVTAVEGRTRLFEATRLVE